MSVVRMCRYALVGEVAGRERRFLLRAGLNRVGRREDLEVPLPLAGVSKHHATLRVRPGGDVVVEDLASRNGTFVDGARVAAATLRPKAELAFGPVRLTLHELPPAEGKLGLALSESALPSPEPATEGETPVLAAPHGGPPDRPAAEAGRGLRFPPGHVPGRSAAMTALYAEMAAVAGTELPVLVLGATGVGKEAVAHSLHRSSPRAAGPFLALNCAALPAELLEAELFGVATGAATGVEGRRGTFELARGGTIFLDEIAEMPAPLQAKLLRALQEKEVHPVGGRPAATDVRVIAATNAEPRAALRRDLYYRLAGFVLRVPPLAERREDIPALIEHFLARAVRASGRRVRGLTAGALRRLVEAPWEGNVRELETAVQRLVYLSAGSVLDSASLACLVEGGGSPREPRAGSPAAGRPPAPAAGPGKLDFSPLPRLRLAEVERQAVEEALRRSDGNQSRAARTLGISRDTLRRRMRSYGLLPR